jgi:hypothetical protein
MILHDEYIPKCSGPNLPLLMSFACKTHVSLWSTFFPINLCSGNVYPFPAEGFVLLFHTIFLLFHYQFLSSA